MRNSYDKIQDNKLVFSNHQITHEFLFFCIIILIRYSWITNSICKLNIQKLMIQIFLNLFIHSRFECQLDDEMEQHDIIEPWLRFSLVFYKDYYVIERSLLQSNYRIQTCIFLIGACKIAKKPFTISYLDYYLFHLIRGFS